MAIPASLLMITGDLVFSMMKLPASLSFEQLFGSQGATSETERFGLISLESSVRCFCLNEVGTFRSGCCSSTATFLSCLGACTD